MQMKNELFMNVLHDFFPMIWKEFLIFFYVILREPFLIKAWFEMWTLVPRMLKKRKEIMKNKRAGWREMQTWLSGKRSEYLLSGK